MPYMRINYRSDWVGRKDLSVFYPIKAPDAEKGRAAGQDTPYRPFIPEGGKLQVLYLLHGSSGDFTDWPLNTMIMKICEAARIIVVMPTVQDFQGTRIELGDFYSCISGELPEFICNILPASPARDDNFIAGYGEGGQLAFRIALNNPDRYAAAGSFGEPITDHPDMELKDSETAAPALFQACVAGAPDREKNNRSRRFFTEAGYEHKWLELPGENNHVFFNAALAGFLDWLPLKGEAVFPDKNIVLPRGGRFYED